MDVCLDAGPEAERERASFEELGGGSCSFDVKTRFEWFDFAETRLEEVRVREKKRVERVRRVCNLLN